MGNFITTTCLVVIIVSYWGMLHKRLMCVQLAVFFHGQQQWKCSIAI